MVQNKFYTMIYKIYILLILFITSNMCVTRGNPIESTPTPITEQEDAGEQLILSSYLENGEIEKARELSIVDPKMLMENITSYSGYITVNKTYNSHLYFWYFPIHEGNVSEAPFTIWLQGGPGFSSLYGIFEEIGPFKIDSNGNLIANNFSWHQAQSILFIDNPTATGFSVTDIDGYVTDELMIGDQLYIFLEQFYKIFYELQPAPLFIAGESYAGKYVPSLAYEIHTRNPTAEIKINLQGISIGNGLIDPESMHGYGDYLYQIGMIDENAARELKSIEEGCANFSKEENYDRVFGCRMGVLQLYKMISGTDNLYDVRSEEKFTLDYPFIKFIEQTKIRKALHVGNTPFFILRMHVSIIPDVYRSYKFQLEEILKHYRVMIYNGQFDIIVAYPLTLRTIKNLNWSSIEEYLEAPRERWMFGNVVAGYTKQAGNLLEVLVRNAGHSVPVTQPERALSLITHFIKNETLPLYSQEPWYMLFNESEMTDENETESTTNENSSTSNYNFTLDDNNAIINND